MTLELQLPRKSFHAGTSPFSLRKKKKKIYITWKMNDEMLNCFFLPWLGFFFKEMNHYHWWGHGVNCGFFTVLCFQNQKEKVCVCNVFLYHGCIKLRIVYKFSYFGRSSSCLSLVFRWSSWARLVLVSSYSDLIWTWKIDESSTTNSSEAIRDLNTINSLIRLHFKRAETCTCLVFETCGTFHKSLSNRTPIFVPLIYYKKKWLHLKDMQIPLTSCAILGQNPILYS